MEQDDVFAQILSQITSPDDLTRLGPNVPIDAFLDYLDRIGWRPDALHFKIAPEINYAQSAADIARDSASTQRDQIEGAIVATQEQSTEYWADKNSGRISNTGEKADAYSADVGTDQYWNDLRSRGVSEQDIAATQQAYFDSLPMGSSSLLPVWDSGGVIERGISQSSIFDEGYGSNAGGFNNVTGGANPSRGIVGRQFSFGISALQNSSITQIKYPAGTMIGGVNRGGKFGPALVFTDEQGEDIGHHLKDILIENFKKVGIKDDTGTLRRSVENASIVVGSTQGKGAQLTITVKLDDSIERPGSIYPTRSGTFTRPAASVKFYGPLIFFGRRAFTQPQMMIYAHTSSEKLYVIRAGSLREEEPPRNIFDLSKEQTADLKERMDTAVKQAISRGT